MTKNLVLMALSMIILLPSFAAQETEEALSWYLNLEEAQTVSKESGSPILINFTGSDWCSWCFKLHDEVFSQPEFIEYAQNNLILVKLDFPRNIPQTDAVKAYNNNLAKKYGIQGFPTIMLVDENADIIAKTGYQYGGAAKYVDHLKELLGQE